MRKYKNSNRKVKLSRCFLDVFCTYKISSSSKNLLIDILSLEAPSGFIRLPEITNKDRLKKNLQELLSQAFFNGDTPIFDTLTYDKGKIVFSFSAACLAAQESSRQYACVPLNTFKKLSSKHAKTLFLKMLFWRDSGKLFIGWRELSLLFGKRAPANFVHDVFDPAILEIREKTNFKISLMKLKKGLLTLSFASAKPKKKAKSHHVFGTQEEARAFEVFTEKYHQQSWIVSKALNDLGIKRMYVIYKSVVENQDRIRNVQNYVYKMLCYQLEGSQKPQTTRHAA